MTTKLKGRGMFRERPSPEERIVHTPTNRQVAWMMFLNLHGCLPTSYLFDLEGPKREAQRRSAQDQLKRLWLAGYIYRPKQQRATDNANYHQYVYDLTDDGREYLKKHGLWVDAIRPTGNWVHQLFVSTVTATMHIMCLRNRYRYVPAHEYLRGRSMTAEVPFKWEKREHTLPLAPDAVFAVDYGGGSFIAYALEADRNTEPNASHNWNRKSDLRTVRQYGSFIGGRRYRDAYKREAMMVLLYVTVSAGHAANFVGIVANELKNPNYIAVGVVPEFQTPFRPPMLLSHLFEEALIRAGRDPFFIKKAA